MVLDVTFSETDEEIPVSFAELLRSEGGLGAVYSVNGKTGDVTLDAADVGAIQVIAEEYGPGIYSKNDLCRHENKLYRYVSGYNIIEITWNDEKWEEVTVADELTRRYIKPENGIRKVDLSEGVQTSLTRADNAQPKISINGLLKGYGNGGVMVAHAGEDYQAPLTAGTDYQTPLTAGTDYQTPLTAGTDYETPAGAKALGLTGASVGDLVRVAAVDASGRPTSWNHVPLCDVATNKNMLDNWDFTNPVNQRGQTAWSNANEYTVDRWKLTSGTASLGANGLTLNGTLVQILETKIGQSVTCSALLSNGTMITPTYNDSTKAFTITATGQTIKAAKLEIGSEQTLAHRESNIWVLNELPDYYEEWRKCQRYLWIPQYSAKYSVYGFGIAYSSTGAYFILYPPTTMASVPAVSKSTVVPGSLRIRSGSGSSAGAIMPSSAWLNLNGSTKEALQINCEVAAITEGAAAFLYRASGAAMPFLFSCEP